MSCVVGEWAMQDHNPDIGVGKGHGYLILEKLGENFFCCLSVCLFWENFFKRLFVNKEAYCRCNHTEMALG